MEVGDVTVVVLERDRHDALIARAARVGRAGQSDPRRRRRPSIAAAQSFSGVDMLMGIGGTPEGVISAAAIKCLGRGDPGQALAARRRRSGSGCIDAGYDVDKVLTTDDLVASDNVFVAATGVTSGALLRGARASAQGVETESIVMRSRSGTVRRIAAYHPSEKVQRLRRSSQARRKE